MIPKRVQDIGNNYFIKVYKNIMNIQEYRKQVQRTLPDLGSKLLNSIHMTLGIGSEFLEEAIQAIGKEDKVNITEELADVQWYLCNYANIHDIYLLNKFPIISTGSNDIFIGFESIGKLQDIDKKELAYGKEVDSKDSSRVEPLYNIFSLTESVADEFNIDMNEARQKVINKLKLRYPDRFDCDKAINRDTDAERKILES